MSDEPVPVEPREFPLTERRTAPLPSAVDARLDLMQQSTDRLTQAVTRLTTVIDRVESIEQKADSATHVAEEASQLVVHAAKHGDDQRHRIIKWGAVALSVVAVLFAAGALLILKHTSDVTAQRNQVARVSCEARNLAQARSGKAVQDLLTGLAAIEMDNPFVSKPLAAKRVAVYKAAEQAFSTGTLIDCAALYPHTHYTPRVTPTP